MLDVTPGLSRSNSAVVPVGANGRVAVYNNTGNTHVIVDVQGYFTTTSTSDPGRGGFVPVTQTRIVDTRSGLGVPKGAIPPNQSLTVPITGLIPTSANAAFLNVTATNAATGGFLTASPSDTSSSVSLLDYTAGTTSFGCLPEARTGRQGDLRQPWCRRGGPRTRRSGVLLRRPARRRARVCDQPPLGCSTPGRPYSLGANETADFSVAGAAGLPTAGLDGAVINLHAFAPTEGGFLRAWRADEPAPTTSNVNFAGAQVTRDGVAALRLGVGGKIRVRNVSAGLTGVVADLQGLFAVPVPTMPVEDTAPLTALQASPIPRRVAGSDVPATSVRTVGSGAARRPT